MNDALIQAFRALLARFAHRLDYLARYPCTVVSQSGQKLEVRPEDARLPTSIEAPIRLGIPNTTVQVAKGSRVLIGFENGNPQKPFIDLWDNVSTITEINFANGANNAARVNDQVVGTAGPYTINAHIAPNSSKVKIG